jgi:hypothetical protein
MRPNGADQAQTAATKPNHHRTVLMTVYSFADRFRASLVTGCARRRACIILARNPAAGSPENELWPRPHYPEPRPQALRRRLITMTASSNTANTAAMIRIVVVSMFASLRYI